MIYFSPVDETFHKSSLLVFSKTALSGLIEAITIVNSLPLTIFLILPDFSITSSSPSLTSPPCSDTVEVSARTSPALTLASSFTRTLEPVGKL